MKAYTDILQSKILAEILPIESADMKWYFWKSEIDAPKLPTFGYGKEAAETCKSTEVVYLPCWSLATLLGALPDKVLIDGHFWSLSIGRKGISYLGYMTYDGQLHLSVENDNLIDACYEMILKLKEQKLI